ncbi:hypothetical protein [Pseudomonas mandelii]
MEEQFTQGMLEPGLRVELIRLLKEDAEVRQLVLGIVAAPASVLIVEPEPQPVAVAPQPPHECPLDPLRDQLNAQLNLLATLCADEGLSRFLLVQSESEGLQLTRLLATAAQWERLLELWDVLAERCKTASSPASAAELQILNGCLQIHNLIWRDRQAQLRTVEVGVEYDYRLHNRTTLRGEVIAAQWLPGLANAGGNSSVCH